LILVKKSNATADADPHLPEHLTLVEVELAGLIPLHLEVVEGAVRGEVLRPEITDESPPPIHLVGHGDAPDVLGLP
jgi:hypothetical protein